MMLNMRAVSSLVGKRTQLLRYATRRGFSFITQGGPAEQSVSAVSKRGAESSSKKVLGTILFGVMALTTAGLGCWQADRYRWKTNLIEDTKKKMSENAVSWKEVDEDSKQSLHGRKIVLRGKFDHAKEILLGPRPPPVGVFGPAAQGMATNPSGYYVITPFRAEDGRLVLVNRGWVGRQTKTWSHPADSKDIELLVIMSDMEKRGTFSPVNDHVSKKLLWLEYEAVMKAMGYDKCDADERPSYVLEAVVDDVTNKDMVQLTNFPVPKMLSKAHEQYVGPPTHIAYATTWFSLSIAAIVFGYRMNRKGRPIKPTPRPSV